jgi:hypothetical protein
VERRALRGHKASKAFRVLRVSRAPPGLTDPLELTVPKALKVSRDCPVLMALTEPKVRRESRESKAFRESRAQQERTARRVRKAPKGPLVGMS